MELLSVNLRFIPTTTLVIGK